MSRIKSQTTPYQFSKSKICECKGIPNQRKIEFQKRNSIFFVYLFHFLKINLSFYIYFTDICNQNLVEGNASKTVQNKNQGIVALIISNPKKQVIAFVSNS